MDCEDTTTLLVVEVVFSCVLLICLCNRSPVTRWSVIYVIKGTEAYFMVQTPKKHSIWILLLRVVKAQPVTKANSLRVILQTLYPTIYINVQFLCIRDILYVQSQHPVAKVLWHSYCTDVEGNWDPACHVWGSDTLTWVLRKRGRRLIFIQLR